MNLDICTKLYQSPIGTVKQTEDDVDAVISDLPAATLKWIKKHRRLDCDAKMVLSHNRERQLRDMFNGIDVGKHGSIDLVELEEAVSFVKERLEKKLGTFDGFNQIIKVFKSMDVNGDGKVDFREFTNAMSGSTRSALAKASEHDVANLHRCFLEFGVLKARRHAIAKINDYTGLSFSGEHILQFDKNEEEAEQTEIRLQRQKSLKNHEIFVMVDDHRRYDLFRTLFAEQRDTTSGAQAKEMEDLVLSENAKRLHAKEQILKEFLEMNKKELRADDANLEREAEFDLLQSRLHEDRKKAAEAFAKDPDAMAEQALHEEGLKYFAQRRRKQRPVTATNSTLRNVNGELIHNSLNRYTTNMLPPEVDARGELAVRLQAKKEAYDILRSIRYMRPHEKQSGIHNIIDSLQIYIPPAEGEDALESGQSHSREDTGSRSTSNLPTPTSSTNTRRKPPLYSHAHHPSPTNNTSNVTFIKVQSTHSTPAGRAKSALRKSRSLDAMLNCTTSSPSHKHNNNISSSRPPSRSGFYSAARPSTAAGYSSAGHFAERPDSTPPVTVRLTSHAAILSSSPSSPIVTARLPAYIATVSRPSTVGAIGARKHTMFASSGSGHSKSGDVGGDKKPQHARCSLRSPKLMVQPAFS